MALCLMYHCLARSTEERDHLAVKAGRHALTQEAFLNHVSMIKQAGWRFITPDDVMSGESLEEKVILLSFDDSWATHLWAAERLSEWGVTGIFNLNSGLLGQEDMLDAASVRKIASLGHEIGSHGVSHAFFDVLDDGSLQAALIDSKRDLEGTSGKAVRMLSLPGGRWDRRVWPMAAAAGYKAVFTSRPGFLKSQRGLFGLNRVAITADIRTRYLWGMVRLPRTAIALLRSRYVFVRAFRRLTRQSGPQGRGTLG